MKAKRFVVFENFLERRCENSPTEIIRWLFNGGIFLLRWGVSETGGELADLLESQLLIYGQLLETLNVQSCNLKIGKFQINSELLEKFIFEEWRKAFSNG